MKNKIILFLVLVVGAVALIFFVKNISPASISDSQTTTVKIDGSSTVFPITEAMAEEFQKQHSDIHVTVGISGTGGGFEKFCRGEIDINDASRPIKETEAALCKQNNIDYIELPIAFDGLSVMVNPSNTWVDYITVAELKKIWQPEAKDTVMYWDQVRKGWPHKKINLYGPGTDSGTYDYFTQAIVGKEGSSRPDFTSSEDDNVLVQGIASDPLSLGFFGFAYYQENKEKLKLIAVAKDEKSTVKDAIFPSLQTINDGSYSPLSRPIFIYPNRQKADDASVSAFINFYINTQNAKNLISEVGYVPFPDELYGLVQKRFENRTAGSVFKNSGSHTGVTIQELLADENK
jgi:phosphate transport system substrate-binding protein